MYDLDMSTAELVKEYNKFHKWIIARGYIMMQYSIYIKTIISPSKKDYEVKAIKQKLPKNGNVRILTITNRQYYDIDMLRGDKNINESINTDQRRIKIKDELN